MKRFLFSLFLSIFIFVSNGIAQNIPERPSPPRLVNDFTNTLTPDQQQALEQKLVAYDDSTSNQIAVVIVPTTNDYAPVDYATKLGRAWGVGNKKTNNGVVILIAKNDHQIFIAPGYGLEGALPDITCNSIIENEIKPNFRADDYFHGLDLGTTALMKAAAGEYKAPANYRSTKGNNGGGSIIGIIIIIVIVLMLAGRGGGSGGGGMFSRRGYGGFLGGALLGNALGGGSRGGWSGGDSGGGGGGGFGGFGGGSFGGGGSGGSW